MVLIVWPRTRHLCDHAGFAQWLEFTEQHYSHFNYGASLGDALTRANAEGALDLLPNKRVVSIMYRFGLRLYYDVLPQPHLMEAVVKLQRRFRQKRAALAVAMGLHKRLGQKSCLSLLDADLLCMILGFS
jgi:hypothetical protein